MPYYKCSLNKQSNIPNVSFVWGTIIIQADTKSKAKIKATEILNPHGETILEVTLIKVEYKFDEGISKWEFKDELAINYVKEGDNEFSNSYPFYVC